MTSSLVAFANASKSCALLLHAQSFSTQTTRFYVRSVAGLRRTAFAKTHKFILINLTYAEI